MKKRIHILGPSGSGTTTLGGNLAVELGIERLDTDDFFWRKTSIPFSEKNSVEERLRKLRAEMARSDEWVLSGSLCGWGDSLVGTFTHVVFLWVPWEVRRARLLARETERYGAPSLAPGGAMHEIHVAFMDWCSRYDTAGRGQRSRQVHEAWMVGLPREIILVRLEGEMEEALLTERAFAAIRSK
jgi:adenylate kinase family enzyme